MTTSVNSVFLESVPLSIPSTLLSSRPVTNGEPVNAEVTNRLPSANELNIACIHDLIKRFRDMSGEYLWRMPIAPDVVVGDFVYFDAYSRVFKKGLAKFTVENDRIYEAETSLVWGVVVLISEGKADICTNGLCEFTPATDRYSLSPVSGIRFLSDTVYGGLSDEAKAPYKCVGFLVGVKPTGEVQFFVRPYLSVDTRIHQHKSYMLASVPSGDWSQESDHITNINVDFPGWLPADHPIFAGKAPIGACFGYNPNFLKGCGWPVQPPSTARLKWQRSDEGIPLLAAVPSELYIIDQTTIWWLSTNVLPWAKEFPYTAGVAETPVLDYAHRIWLEILGGGHDISETIVTTLRAGKSSGLSVRQYPYGGQAVSGDLEIGLDLAFDEEVVPEGLGHAVGTIAGLTLKKTPVVSRIQVNSRVLRVNSQFSDGNYHYGTLTFSDPTGIIGAEIPIEATHLNGVEEILVREAVGLSFSHERPSSLLTQMLVPYDDLFTSLAVSIRLGILVPQQGNISSNLLNLSYRIIKNPSVKNRVVLAFPSAEMISLPCDCSLYNPATPHGYYFVESDRVPVSPGDIFILKIERNPPDGFLERFILLRKSGMLHFV